MRIAYLSTFYPFRGGIAQFNASLLRALEKNGHEVKAFTFTTQYPSLLFPGETQMVQKGDSADPIPSSRILNSANPLSYIIAARKIKKYKPDILLMKYWMTYFGPSLGYVASKMTNKTKVVSILDNVIPHEKKFFDKSFNKYFLKRNDYFITMSEKVKNDLLGIKPKAKCKLIPHPLYNHFGELSDKLIARKKLGLHTNKKTLLFFGFIREYKGLDLLIKSFSKLDDSYQLVIAGEVYGSYEQYQKLIDYNPYKHNIHSHVKYIRDEDVGLYFSASDVCVLPYKSATQSGITGISFHFETPMIATDVGGLSEIITHGKTGLISENISEESLSNLIQKYFDIYSSEIFIDNIKLLKKQLSWENFALELIRFVND